MDIMTHAWLFVRGDESIRVIRAGTRSVLRVFGPGRTQQSHKFESDLSLDDFWQSFRQHLSEAGWVLHDVADRRRYREDAAGVDPVAAHAVMELTDLPGAV